MILFLAAIIYTVLSAVTLTILVGPLSGGFVLMMLRAWDREDRRIDFGDLFGAFDRFFPLLGLFYLTFICYLFGIILLIVPGLLLMTFWFFDFLLFIDKRMGVFQALGTSFRIVSRKDFGMVFLLLVIELALMFAPEVVPILGIILSCLVTPLVFGLSLSAYVQLVREDDGTLADLFQEQSEG